MNNSYTGAAMQGYVHTPVESANTCRRAIEAVVV